MTKLHTANKINQSRIDKWLIFVVIKDLNYSTE